MKYEVLWYKDEGMMDYESRSFCTRKEAMSFYKKHKNDAGKYGWWVTKRDEYDWSVLEDLVW